MGKTIKLEWHRVGGTRTRCLRITAKEEKAVRRRLQSGTFVVLETRKDGTKFLSRAFRKLAERERETNESYQEKQGELIEAVVGVAHSYAGVWRQVSKLVAELDALAGFADLAVSAGYCKPKMLPAEAGRLVLRGSRHPCVEAQEGDMVGCFVPNDCEMVKGQSWFQVITGPNMGGKSTFIRQVGCIVLMSQCGCFVPCSEAEVSLRDAIYARVGAGDNQLRGVSTFMAEMLETAAILKGATSASLVIIDELGRGTSTQDGQGLAQAISEHLMQDVGAPTLFATHFHELSTALTPLGATNLHVETDLSGAGNITLLYQVKPGACNKSFGIAVAEKVNFPAEVIQIAKEYEEHSKRRRIEA
uniref:DNA mismatch repair proteins mutS family domain-containing protein n=1 Tax=Chloropicon laureae TaxID=464258 RepID=A0A7S2Z125_9CHLO